MSKKSVAGGIGEEIAALFLKLKDYEIVSRNLRTRRSEIDIVASRSGCLVFVEVKLRGRERFSEPVDCLDRRKREHMTRGALHFLQSYPEKSYHTVRFDIVAITWGRERLVLEHIEDAFPAEGLSGW